MCYFDVVMWVVDDVGGYVFVIDYVGDVLIILIGMDLIEDFCSVIEFGLFLWEL